MRSDCSWTGVPIDRRVRVAIAGCVLLASLGITAALADQVVYFVNGKAIMVKSVEKGPKFTTLEVEGGGKIGVPTEQIDRIEEYQISPPGGAAPAIVQAPVAAPQPVLVPPAVPVAMARTEQPAVQAPAPVPVGPGLGGKVDPALARSAAALRPINLGGGDSPAAPFGPMRAGVPAFAGPNNPFGPGGRGVGPGMAGRMMGGPGGPAGRMGRRGPGGGRAVGWAGQQGGSQPPGSQAPAPTPAAQNSPPSQPSTQQQTAPPQEDPPAANEPPADNGSETDAPATEEGEPSDGGSP